MTRPYKGSFFDTKRGWWAYRWLHHLWVLSFNRNKDLYRVVWWSKYTRPLLYNSKGHIRGGGGDSFFLSLFIPYVVFFTILFLIFG